MSSKTDVTGRGKVKPVVIGECDDQITPVRYNGKMRWICESHGYTRKKRVEYRQIGVKK